MRKTNTEIIDELKFEFTQLSSRKALPIYTFLGSLVAKTAGKAAGAIKDFEAVNGLQDFLDSTNVDISQIIGALAESIATIDENPKLESYIDTLLDSVICEGKSLNLDSLVFDGKMKLLTKVVIASVKFNFSDFFGEKGEIGEVMRKATSLRDTNQEKAI